METTLNEVQNDPSFEDLGVRSETVASLAEKGITHPFRIQQLALPRALDGTGPNLHRASLSHGEC